MFGVAEVELEPGNLKKNYVSVLIAAYILGDDAPTRQDMKDAEEDILRKICSFTIVTKCRSITRTVEKKNLHLAMLLHYLAERHARPQFDLTESDRKLIRAYFPADVVEGSGRNSVIKLLLSEEPVAIQVKTPRRF